MVCVVVGEVVALVSLSLFLHRSDESDASRYFHKRKWSDTTGCSLIRVSGA